MPSALAQPTDSPAHDAHTGPTGSVPASAHETAAAAPDLSVAPLTCELSLTPSPPSPPLPSLPSPDRPLLARLFALKENYTALANELMATASATPDGHPKDLLDLMLWADRPDIAAWIDRFRTLSEDQRRTLALTTLEEAIKSSPTPTERRRAATTILRVLDHKWPSRSRSRERSSPSSSANIRNRAIPPAPADRSPPSPRLDGGRWSRLCETGEGRARVRSNSGAGTPPLPPPPPLSQPTSDPTTELQLLRTAFNTPQPSVALATLHAHTTENSSFASHPISPDPTDFIATTQKILPTGFRFPIFLADCEETERTPTHSHWKAWATTTDKTSFRCALTLIRDGPEAPDPCWRLHAFTILHRSG